MKSSPMRKIKEYIVPPKKIKVAITGLSTAGKTVFITSLLNQLEFNRTKISEDLEIASYTPYIPKEHNSYLKIFPYEKYKECILKSKWPKNTDDVTMITLRMEVRKNNNKKKIFDIEIIDYPGEKLLDLALHTNKDYSYEQWSTEAITWLESINEEIANDYLLKIQELPADASLEDWKIEIHQEYVKILKELKKKHYSRLTPGIFLLEDELPPFPPASDEDKKSILYFTPLLDNCSKSPLYKKYKENFREYVSTDVKKMQTEYFTHFDMQIVLLDILKVLENGHTYYTDMQEVLNKIYKIYDYKELSFFQKLISGKMIKKVIFVGTKSDLFLRREQQDYLNLLEKMTEIISNDLTTNNIKVENICISSIMCAEEEGEILKTINKKNPLEVEKRVVNHIPSEFPQADGWRAGKYSFGEFPLPEKTYGYGAAFDHINMNRIIKAIWEEI